MSRRSFPKAYEVEAALEDESTDKLDLNRLRARLGEKPRTKVGQVRQAWPEIKALLGAGHSLKDIWAWLNEIGIQIGYARLSHYIGQLRLRDQDAAFARKEPSDYPRLALEGPIPNAKTSERLPVRGGTPADPSHDLQNDAIANVRDREQRRSGFQYNAEPEKKKLI